MKIETFPLIIGIIVALLGIGIIFDAWTPDTVSLSQERRRRPRIERHRNGEALIGFGVLALAGAFIGRDNWSYSVLVVIIGAIFLVVGAVLNRSYVRELLVNRGPLRRRDPEAASTSSDFGSTEQETPLTVRTEPPRPEGAAQTWDGIERRQTPRDSGKRQKQKGRSSEDPASH